ncbi:hypothetical protein [Acrocarpospora catenulata]|uniref:hypothetical protein n=1 Tax=Acrocarpospora catenulata TaxID=2836182 RepID=UPI001BDB1CDB|nr:hypothetical protein [Acrocarpospora catenulata]
MYNLGLPEYEQGDVEEARRWYFEAAATSHPDYAARARSELRDLDRREEEQRRASW